MANKTIVLWPKEDIPDTDDLYMRAHKMHFRAGGLRPQVFRKQGAAMSTDWSRYSSPEATRERARVAKDNAVIAFAAGAARNLRLTVDHTPDRATNNRAHTDVSGNVSDPEVRLKLRRKTRILIDLDSRP